MTTTISVPAASKRLSLNDREHWRARAAVTAQWRANAGAAALAIPIERRKHGPSIVQCDFAVADRRRRDGHNLMPTVKAIIDGLVDAGVFDDDDTTRVAVADSTFRVTGSSWRADPVTVNITPAVMEWHTDWNSTEMVDVRPQPAARRQLHARQDHSTLMVWERAK